MGRNKKKKREYEEVRIYCFYCDRQFKDEEILIDHQRAKHFRCEVCNKKLSTAKGLATHCYQVHRVEVKSVPNAKEGNDSIELDIYGMAGVDEALVTLGRAPEEPDSKQAKAEEAVAPVAVPASVPPPGVPVYPGAPPMQPYGHPPYPYPHPQPGYGYPPPGAVPYGYPPPWPVRPGMPPPPGAPGHPPPGYHMPPGMPGHPAAWPQPPAAVPAGPSAPAAAAAAPTSAPPQAPLFPVASGGAPTSGSAPAAATATQPSPAATAEETNPLADGLVWKENEMSMEERRASLGKYVASPAGKSDGA